MTEKEQISYEEQVKHAMDILVDMIPHNAKNNEESKGAKTNLENDEIIFEPQPISRSEIDSLFE